MTPLSSTVMNAVPTLLLRSPLHRIVSSRYLLLTFTGRQSGRRFTTPVAYVGDQDRLFISTDSPWSRNVIGGRTVTVRLRGEAYTGTGHRVEDPVAGEAAMRSLLRIPGYARAAGVERTDGEVSDHDIRGTTRERTVIAIELGGRS